MPAPRPLRPAIAWLALLLICVPAAADSVPAGRSVVELPSSKRLLRPIPGDPRLAGGFPTTIALSPDRRYAALLDDGYGMEEAGQRQGIAVLDLQTGRFRHFAESRLGPRAQQTFFLGLAFSLNGDRLYASVASISDPSGRVAGNTGNGIAVYAFDKGAITPKRFLTIPPQMMPAGKLAAAISSNVPLGYAVPYPAGLFVYRSAAGERLLVANDLADNAVALDPSSGEITRSFDLSTARDIPSSFPYAVIASRDGRRAFCSLWNASAVAELDLVRGMVVRMIELGKPGSATAAGSHPTGMALSPDESRLFVTLANSDSVAVIDTANGAVRAELSTKLPGQRYLGASPTALAVSEDAKRLFVADSSANAIAVFDLAALGEPGAAPPVPLGFIPTEWYPTALALHGGELLVATGKGRGTRANVHVDAQPHPYIAALLHGSIARIALAPALAQLPQLTGEAVFANRIGEPEEQLFEGRPSPIKHVLYIIKENRSYDQVLGDLGVGDGDPELTLYGRDITPNQHRLALQFGVLDNFYDSGEVSGDGHVWSTAAITSDYTEKTWQIGYRGREHSYDYEGEVARELPLYQGHADVNEPSTGYLWVNAARHGKSYRHYGEYVLTFWCESWRKVPPYLMQRAADVAKRCAHPTLHPGEPVPARLGHAAGEASPWPWQIPLPAYNVATKPELRGHFDRRFPDFQVDYPDQWRADEFLIEFREFVSRRTRGDDRLPQLMVARLPNDHTGGTRPGMARPAASIADNDLALGRVVDAISHSPYWDDTAILVLEDDAQNGADHVDAHRSIAFVISKYSPRLAKPFVDHRVYTTVSMVRTIEALLGLPPMNANDALAASMAPLFTGHGDQPPFNADYRNRDNGLLYQTNPVSAPGADASKAMDFSRADAVNSQELNEILWKDAKGTRPMPVLQPVRAPAQPDKASGAEAR